MAVEKILQILASLVALIGITPVFLYLDPLAQTTLILALVCGFWADRRKKQLLPPLPATLLSFLAFFFYLSQMSRNIIVEPLVNMLVLLLAVRLVTEKSGRNLLQIFVLATFVLAASSLLSLSASYLLILILLITLVTFGLLLTSFYATQPNLQLNRSQWFSLLRTGAILPAGSLLLMILFFAILPRTQHPLWHFLNPGAKASAGFSEEVKPGSIADLGTSGLPAFRAEMTEIAPQELYWRGLVLNTTDGRSWTRSKAPPADIEVKENRPKEAQTIFIEPRADRYLPGLDRPSKIIEIGNRYFDDGVFKAKHRLDRRRRYRVESDRDSRAMLRQTEDAEFYLRTPKQISPRLAEVALEIARKTDRQAKIRAAEAFFIHQQLSYGARDLQLSETPVETFLFESKRGYCEYFASSFALLLRYAGVPSRLVGGYLGGRYNNLGRYYLVDQDMAHVWVEALDDSNHWQRIDPSRLAINANEAVTGLARRPFNWSQATTDFLETAWSRLVITYDLQKQLKLIVTTGQNLRQLKPKLSGDLSWWLAALVLLACTIIFTRSLKSRPSHQEKLLQKYLGAVCSAAGINQLPPNIGIYKLAELSHEPLCRDFAEIYGEAYYQDKPLKPDQYRQLNKLIRQISRRHINLDLSTKSAPDSSRLTEFGIGKD